MNNRIDAIYARQSVDKKDSISIENQIEFCKYELKGGNCKEYKDKGYSGKNTERPQFQQLMRDIESGLVRKVVVYKLDRISRSILDFAKMMDFFQKYEVEFVSSTEKFDTSTPMGRAMLNICIVFAQLERETIQKRVQDAWYSRCQRGFKMGGKTPYGFRTEPYVMDGVRTKKLVIEPNEAAFVRQMYEMYADPQVSLHDITKKLTADGIPAHPQKQYTRRWRLYHFCGFYYPIREVIPIAIYHWNIGIVSRGKGKSAVAAAAYRSGEKLTNEWDGMTHDYTRKGGVVHTEIMLPLHAPPSFSDRSTLWNSVELYEKAGNAQLAREIDAALPIELSREEQIRLVREYCSSQFVSRGMCVDFAIHDTDSGNPHCHIMLTMRPLDGRGAWAAKSKKEYDLDENGERIRLPSGRYKTHKVDLTGWNDKDNTLLWRKAWADFTNDFLERNGSPERIDHRSNAERGIDEIPTVHMGVAACQMEKKGIATEKGELNRSIQKTNRLIREIRAQIGKLKEWIADLFKARETAPEQPPQSPNLANLLMKYLSVQREKSRKYSQSWQHQHAADELKTISQAANYLAEHGISTLDELDASLSSVSDEAFSIREGMKTAEQRMKELQKLIENGENYLQ